MIEQWAELELALSNGSGTALDIRNHLFEHREALRRVVEAAKEVAINARTKWNEPDFSELRKALAELERQHT